MSLITILEKIKDKVEIILNRCKCDDCMETMDEIKLLVKEYNKRKRRIKTNKYIIEDKPKYLTKKQNNSNKNKILTKTTKTEFYLDTNTIRESLDVQTNDNHLKGESTADPSSDEMETNDLNGNKINRNSNDMKLTEEESQLITEDQSSGQFLCQWTGCEKKFNALSLIRVHIRTHTGVNHNKYECHYPDCGRTFDRRSTYDYHIKKHEIKGFKYPKTIVCEWLECEKKFPFRHQMNKHIREKHLKIIRFRCTYPECENKGFANKNLFDSHIRQVHETERHYRCEWPDCDKRYKTIYAKNKHYRHVHLNKRDIKCLFAECVEHFDTRTELEKHMNEEHNGVNPLSCDWPGCEFSTIDRKSLSRHKLRHTGERPHKCLWPSCEWSFRSSDNLKTHMLKHTGERPVVCADANCALRFQTNQSMRIHYQRVHSLAQK